MKSLGACVVSFRRKEGGPWERGIAVMGDTAADLSVIVDMDGKVVAGRPSIWNYNLLPHEGCFFTRAE